MSMHSKEAVRDLAPVDPWSTAPFDPPAVQDVRRVVQLLNAQQRLWLSGYLAGSVGVATALAEAPVSVPSADPIVTVLYGSQSGNCERLASQVAEALTARGVPHVVLDMLDCRKSHLQEARNLLVIVSTHGEGDPPDRAAALHELLHSRKAPPLKHLKYAVLALGDSSYEHFCETGRQFDARLAALGAESLQARVDCDVDYEQSAREWIDAVVDRLASQHAKVPAQPSSPFEPTLAPVATAYTRKNPFLAPVLANQRLTARDSEKDVRHIELSLEGSGIHYEPGDAIGVVVRNASERVDAILSVVPYAAETPIAHEGASLPLRDVLQGCDIGLVTRTFAEKYLARLGLSERAASIDFARSVQLEDFLREHAPSDLSADEFVKLLRPLAPRLYSIASSPRATPDEVHLTVALVQFELNGVNRYGVASEQFARMTGDDAVAPIYLHRNPNFRLPQDSASPIIMIGPGTGVAPFRGFIAEREAQGARGRNWLFFGERRFQSDFLYQAEWLDYRKRGVLNRIELAFSRDQAQKIYVQHRMREHGRELYAWLQEGAYVYVCGDATRMASDVQDALLAILHEHGGYSAERAAEELLELQRVRRYQRDVY
jgi:sulfite reductase (NADPH) flavoprotein alpha-component